MQHSLHDAAKVCMADKDGNATAGMALPQCPEDTVKNCAHADVPAEHVKSDQDSTPSQLSWEVCSQDAEQHHHNV